MAKQDGFKTVEEAQPAPKASSAAKLFKVTVDGASHVYEARDAAEAWAYHNDKNKTSWAVKQKNPLIEEVK